MKIKLDRVISIATLGASVVAIFLVLKKPEPVAHIQTPAAVAANAQSFGQKMEQLEQAGRHSAASYQTTSPQTQQTAPSELKEEVRKNSDEISAALAQATGAGELSPDSNVGSGAPTIKDQQVSFDGDVVHGQFLTVVAGKDVWVTVLGHLGEKDGY